MELCQRVSHLSVRLVVTEKDLVGHNELSRHRDMLPYEQQRMYASPWHLSSSLFTVLASQ